MGSATVAEKDSPLPAKLPFNKRPVNESRASSKKTSPHEESPKSPARLHPRRFLMSLMTFMSGCTHVHCTSLALAGAEE